MKEFLKNRVVSGVRIIKFLYWVVLNRGFKWKFFSIYNIPIFINNFNRLTHPLQLIHFLEACGFNNIIILDNNSTYPPLLQYYKTCRHRVIHLADNYGHLALWKSGLYRTYRWNYFVYTDSDVVPIEECPKNFIEHFKTLLDTNYTVDKIGFAIKIDDLPDTFSLKEKVIQYEKNYWLNEVKPNVYASPIDTTFALYKPFSSLKAGEIYTLSAFRLGFPYLIRHMPWYIDSQNLSDEELYYLQTSNASSSIAKQRLGSESEVY